MKQLESVGQVLFRRCAKCSSVFVLFSKQNGKNKREVGFIAASIKKAYIREFGNSAFEFASLSRCYIEDEDETLLLQYLATYASRLFLPPCRMGCCPRDDVSDDDGNVRNDVNDVNDVPLVRFSDLPLMRFSDRRNTDTDYVCDTNHKNSVEKPLVNHGSIIEKPLFGLNKIISRHILEVDCEGIVEKPVLRILRANSFDVQIITEADTQTIYICKPNNVEYDLLAKNATWDGGDLDRNVLFGCAVVLGERYCRLVYSNNMLSFLRRSRILFNTASLCKWIVETVGIIVRLIRVRGGLSQLHYRYDANEHWRFHSSNQVFSEKEACKRIVHCAALHVIERLGDLIASNEKN